MTISPHTWKRLAAAAVAVLIIGAVGWYRAERRHMTAYSTTRNLSQVVRTGIEDGVQPLADLAANTITQSAGFGSSRSPAILVVTNASVGAYLHQHGLSQPEDPWGTPYRVLCGPDPSQRSVRLHSTGTYVRITVESAGPDCAWGTSDDIRSH